MESRAEIAGRVFDYWREVMETPRAKMDLKRETAIISLLSIGYEEDDLRAAIDGCKASPFHMGQNDRGTVYNAITLIFRSADKVDAFIAIAEARKRVLAHRQAQKKELGPVNSTSGEVYKHQRGALLALVGKT